MIDILPLPISVSRPKAIWASLLLSLAVLGGWGLVFAPANAIPRFDSAYFEETDTSGIMLELLGDGLPPEIQRLGFSERQILGFYEKRQYQPAFWQSFGWDPSINLALDFVDQAARHALRPEDYASMGMDVAPRLGDPAYEIAAFDAQMTILLARFAHDLTIGRYNPENRENGIDLVAAGLDRSASDRNLSFGTWYQTIAPNTPVYARMLDLYHTMNTAIATDVPEIPEGPLLRKGVEHEQVPLLRDYLVAAGLLSAEAAASSDNPNLFDTIVDEGVRRYQALAGLSADGVIGNQTRQHMNQGNPDLLPKVLVNLERLRWEAPLESQRYIRVNIANYRLQAYEDQEKQLDMRVIVGRRDRPTPILSDRITNLKFAPDWTVPRSILTADYLDSIRANPGYIQSAGFQVKQGGRIIDPFSIDWSVPGVQNQVTLYRPASSYGPLGGVRFSLTNDQAIYLHDTSSPYLFDRAERDRSSGCVRVHEPAKLSEFILEGTDWSPSEIQSAMNGTDTRYARPNEEVQVYLSYLTLWIDDDGKLQTANDPYKLDAKLLQYFAS